MNRRIKQGAFVAAVVTGFGILGAGCLSRPIYTAPPNLKTNFTTSIQTSVIDKIDLLFDIDNSASMGDKQQYLQAAIPDLINRLINPNCVDAATMMVPMGASTMGTCPAGAVLEFPPVHDMHIGIVSSALGPRLGDACTASDMAPAPFANLSKHNDDKAELLSRSLTYAANLSSATEGAVADASQGFLYWYPTTNATPATQGTPVTNSMTLETDFTDMVGGVGVFGCGIESQLETWYRFLIQPDPYDTLVNNGGKATWSGVDTTILQQRHDFLRPDSLVAIIVLTDENDSEIDVRSLSQQGWNWMSSQFPPPRGTAACGIDGVGGNPGDPACTSCAAVSAGTASSDASCKMGAYSATNANDWGYDLNLRHVHTKAKYGLDPQFPIQRYLNGLTSTTVPDRDGEYPGTSAGKITSSGYVGMNDCTNPLYAASLPSGGGQLNQATLCKLVPGPRTTDLVFFAHIGGVPSSLLHFDPTSAANSTLNEGDWTKILGNNSVPPNYDYSGIDPHMLESFQPNRPGIPACPAAPDSDGVCDWVTNQPFPAPATGGHILNVDREYACTFPLADQTGAASPRDCTQPQFQSFCDCPHVQGSVSAAQLPPICNQAMQTQQTGAKAYPTIRELELTHLMGKQGIVSSICPIDVAEKTPGDPLYGYRPAVAVIIDRLKNALTNQCLPEQLPISNGQVPCLILAQLPASTGGSCKNPNCDMSQGLVGPGMTIAPGQTFDPAVLDSFCDSQEAQYQALVSGLPSGEMPPPDPAKQSVCALVQLTPQANPTAFQGGSCKSSTQDGWCYVTGAAAGTCPQAIIFAGQPKSATISLQCIEQSVAVIDGGTSTGTTTSGSGGGGGGG